MTTKTVKVQNTKVWPMTWDDITTWYETPKGITCDSDECVKHLTGETHIWSNTEGITTHHSSRDSWRENTSTEQGLVTCDVCGVAVTGLRPNPYTIPSLPNLGDVKFSVTMPKALDNVFTDAYIWHNTQVWTTANPDKEITYEDRVGFHTYPSNYTSHMHRLMDVTYEEYLGITSVLDRYYGALVTKKTTGLSTNAGSAKMNIKKLRTLLEKEINQAMKDGVEARTSAIKRAHDVCDGYEARGSWVFITEENNNRGMVYVKAYDTAAEGYGAYEGRYNSAEFSQEITVYVNVQEGEAMLRFEQDTHEEVDGTWRRGTMNSYDLNAAIAEAQVELTKRIDAKDAHTDKNALYAAEALVDANIPVTDEVK